MKFKTMVALTLSASGLWANAPVEAQYAYNPYRNSSNFWDRQIGAGIDMSAVITRNAQNSAMTNLMISQVGKGGTQTPQQRGATIIKSGRATNTFPMRPFPLEKWLKIWGAGDAQKRAQAKAEWEIQSTLWRQEVAARKAKWGNIGDMYAVATAMAYEAYSGQRLNDVGYRELAKAISAGFVKDPGFQGRSTVSKQELYEETLIRATNALRLRRAGDAQNAKSQAYSFVGLTWKPANDFFSQMKPYAVAAKPKIAAQKAPSAKINLAPTGQSAITNAKAASNVPMTPAAAWQEAVRITSFQPVAASLVPAQWGGEQSDDKARAQAQQQAQIALDSMREVMRRSDDQSLPPNNVARAMAWALMQLRQVARSTPGQKLGTGETDVTPETMKAARRQLAFTLATDADFRKLSDRDKQQMQEAFLILPAFALVAYEAGLDEHNLPAQKEAREMARQVFQQLFKSDVDKVRFTNDGVVNN